MPSPAEHARATCRHVHVGPNPYDYTNKYNTPLTPDHRGSAIPDAWGQQQAAGGGGLNNPAADVYWLLRYARLLEIGRTIRRGQHGHAGDTFKKQETTFGVLGVFPIPRRRRQQGGTQGGGQNRQPRGRSRHPRPTYKCMTPVICNRYFQQVEAGQPNLILPQSGGRAP